MGIVVGMFRSRGNEGELKLASRYATFSGRTDVLTSYGYRVKLRVKTAVLKEDISHDSPVADHKCS